MGKKIEADLRAKIVADYAELESFRAVGRLNKLSDHTVKAIIMEEVGAAQICADKKEQAALDMLAYMEAKKGKMQEAISMYLAALMDPDKIAKSSAVQLATVYGILVDKATRHTPGGNDSLAKLDGLLEDFRRAIK